jgi:hypothetical protein
LYILINTDAHTATTFATECHNSGKNGGRKKSFLYDHLHILLDHLCKFEKYPPMERLVCLIFKVFSLLFSNFKSLWTKVSRCVQKASRRVHYIGRYEHLIGRYGRIATRYVHNTDRYA